MENLNFKKQSSLKINETNLNNFNSLRLSKFKSEKKSSSDSQKIYLPIQVTKF